MQGKVEVIRVKRNIRELLVTEALHLLRLFFIEGVFSFGKRTVAAVLKPFVVDGVLVVLHTVCEFFN